MRRRWWSTAAAGVAALFLILPAGALPNGEPAPPDHLYGTWESMPGNEGQIILDWEPPTDTGSAPLAGYRVFRFEDGVPLGPATVTAASYTHTGLDPGSVYTYYVTAVNSDGLESAPSNPTTLGDWPRCTVLTWGLDPPDANPHPGCLLPPPV